MTDEIVQPTIEPAKPIDSIIVANPKSVAKSYSSVSLIANFMIAISGVGFASLGALTYLNLTMIFILMSIFTLFGFIGRFIKEDLTDQAPANGPLGFKGVAIRLWWWIKDKFKKEKEQL